ncbi:MAG: hypothetical protein LBK71_01815 [Verrucomicrobiales bacterium]|jgi:predicted DNA-binding protein|nr:hypothetical protein [Verrucomicrobiales bacterium]
MVVLDLDSKIEQRLHRLSRKAGVSAESCATQALVEFLDDLTAAERALTRLRQGGRWYSSTAAKRALGL